MECNINNDIVWDAGGDGGDKEAKNFEGRLLEQLESVTGIFDFIFFLKSVGVIGESNFFYRNLNRSNLGSKLWFVTLVLSVKKNIRDLVKIVRLLSFLNNELGKSDGNGKGRGKDLGSEAVVEKIKQGLRVLKIKLKNCVVELLQDLIYLVIISLEVFRVSVSRKLKDTLEMLSNVISMLKFIKFENIPIT